MRSRRLLAAALAAILVSAGCTATPPPVEPTPSVPQPSASAPYDLLDTDPARLASGGELRAAVPALPTTWNPWLADAATQRLLCPLRSRAFTLDAAGVPRPNPVLVLTADAQHGSRTTVRLTLNPQAVWGDGTPITARDWIATWQAFGVAHLAADPRGWDRIAKVQPGSSDGEVVITYAGVDPDWAQPLIDGPARAESVKDADTFTKGWATFRADWFAGPFIVEHVDSAQGVVTLIQNPGWWGTAPRLDHVTFRALTPEKMTAAFAQGELDWLPLGADRDRIERLSDNGSQTGLRAAPGTSGRELLFRTTGPLADPAVRRAISRAIDPAAVARAWLGDRLTDAPRWANHLVLPTQPGYTDQAVATGSGYDPEAARAALEAVDGPTRLTIHVPDGDDRAAAEASVIATQVGVLGITLTPTTGDADLTLRSRAVSPFPYVGLPDAVGDDDAAVHAVAVRVASETQPVRRADLAAQVARALWLRAETVPLYHELQVVATRNRLANLGASGFGLAQWENVGWAR